LIFAIALGAKSRGLMAGEDDAGHRVASARRRSLEERVLDNLAGGMVLTQGKLRDCLAVKNQRLREVLESLERAGRLSRTAAGWQRLD
jgi:predicted transcriptional regulator of viral defense system